MPDFSIINLLTWNEEENILSILKFSYDGTTSKNNHILYRIYQESEPKLNFSFVRIYEEQNEKVRLALRPTDFKVDLESLLCKIEQYIEELPDNIIIEDSPLIAPGLYSKERSFVFNEAEIMDEQDPLESTLNSTVQEFCISSIIAGIDQKKSLKDLGLACCVIMIKMYDSSQFYTFHNTHTDNLFSDNKLLKEHLVDKAFEKSRSYIDQLNSKQQLFSKLKTEQVSSWIDFANGDGLIENNGGLYALYELLNILGFNAIDSWYLVQIASNCTFGDDFYE